MLTYDISLEDALNQVPVAFKTLDGRKLVFSIDSQISPQLCFLVANEGMPLSGSHDGARGHLYIKFNIKFPDISETTRL